jgi:uncharacterized membrane protein YdjX (TVP38/TMEM64 family)
LIIAGATYGLAAGLIGSLLAISLNLCICYAVAHSKLRPLIQKLFDRFEYKVPDFTAGGRRAWRFAAAIKLTPALPAFAKMYILAVTAVPFAIYFTVSLAISGVFAAVLLGLGDSLFAHDVNHTVLAVIAISLLTIVALKWWQKRRNQVSGGDALSAV